MVIKNITTIKIAGAHTHTQSGHLYAQSISPSNKAVIHRTHLIVVIVAGGQDGRQMRTDHNLLASSIDPVSVALPSGSSGEGVPGAFVIIALRTVAQTPTQHESGRQTTLEGTRQLRTRATAANWTDLGREAKNDGYKLHKLMTSSAALRPP